jgi:hypothetical protein
VDIILVSNRFAKAHSITLHGRHLLLAAMLLVVMIFTAQYFFSRIRPEMLGIQFDGQLKQQSYMRDGMDALAVRVGQMQAQLLRLDSLGARLAKMSGPR